ncbi:hypothetical protein [Glycomyces algeriensis]|uniref:Uncharacterized protein n=1 Tax=Glycomyces algeriensis TaxID=256037 RepID=A0A9W6G5P2_9ACTN|nr:hypothetical protein [Glycomyces algeriensis]MDA1368469.1 hypothetical protein [Glycomyces algeriensis]MDR7353276.1 hypothetical protein [Glycomyces algeriensis]GLI40971.1 hypothetical protein GALLR39Z86_08210 [Glycomyces algeriensis]
MTTLVVLGALVILPLAFIVPAVLWKWRESREQARLAEVRRERQEAAERRLHGAPVSAARSPEAEEVWKEQRAFRAAFVAGGAEPGYRVYEDAYRMLREQNPYYDRIDLDPSVHRCEGRCCVAQPEFWV